MSLLIFARCLCLEMVVMYTPRSPTKKFAIKNTSCITPNVQFQVFVHRRSAFLILREPFYSKNRKIGGQWGGTKNKRWRWKRETGHEGTLIAGSKRNGPRGSRGNKTHCFSCGMCLLLTPTGCNKSKIKDINK